MLELTRLFCVERNIFQKFVIIYKYITFIDKDPITQGILQRIFDDTAKVMGKAGDSLNEDRFLNVESEVIYTNEFWAYYSNLKIIHSRMKKLKGCKVYEETDFNNLCRLFSRPYSAESLKLSFKVVNINIFDHLDQDSFLEDDEDDKKTWFDDKKSILYVADKKILIARRGQDTNAHKILKYIFKDNKENIKDNFFFSEIADDVFSDSEYKEEKNGWLKYYDTCKKINEKIMIGTKNVVDNFLVFNCGKTGCVKINPKYLWFVGKNLKTLDLTLS